MFGIYNETTVTYAAAVQSLHCLIYNGTTVTYAASVQCIVLFTMELPYLMQRLYNASSYINIIVGGKPLLVSSIS